MPKQLKEIVSEYLKSLNEMVTNVEKDIEELTQPVEKTACISRYLAKVNRLAAKAERAAKLHSNRIFSTVLEMAKLKKSINSILEEFHETHELNVRDFWEQWIPTLIDLSAEKPKIISTKLKNEFYAERNRAVSIIKRMSNAASNLLDACKQNNLDYQKEELEKLKNLTLEMVVNSWENDMNPVNGEIYNNVKKP